MALADGPTPARRSDALRRSGRRWCPRGSDDGFGVERLEGVHVEDAGFVAKILLQDPRKRAWPSGTMGPQAMMVKSSALVAVVGFQFRHEGVDEIGGASFLRKRITLALPKRMAFSHR